MFNHPTVTYTGRPGQKRLMNVPPVHNVMFVCFDKKVPVKSRRHRPMTRAEFQNWQDRQVGIGTQHVDCPACGSTHPLIGQDYFLEGDQPPSGQPPT